MKVEANNILLNYFAGFGKGDIRQITENFDENVSLTDWSISCTGFGNVSDAIEKILSNGKISIYPESIFFSTEYDQTVATCIITIDTGQETLKVVDLIRISQEGLIVEISAYKQ